MTTKGIMTFYVWNIPMMGNGQFLKQTLAAKGDMTDFFIPAKTNRTGEKFGFVRYRNVRNVESLARRLDDIWIGSYKIRLKIAKF